jgi:hypothetical protein
VAFLIGGFLIAGKALGIDKIRGASGRCDIEETPGRGKSRRRPLNKGELGIGSYGAREGEEGEGAPIAERVRTGRYLA